MPEFMLQRIKRAVPEAVRGNIKLALNPSLEEKIFCISLQRNGTTSTGKFFKQFGYQVANYRVARRNKWTPLWFNGEYERIFRSYDFKVHQVFEDDPWWCTRFFRVLYHRFPKSRFILFTRNPDRWFDSMVNHSNGKTLGNTYRHAVQYRREPDFYAKLGEDQIYTGEKIDNKLSLGEKRDHYVEFYRMRNRKVKDFFQNNDPSRLICCKLEDKTKWQKLGDFFGFDVSATFDVHANASRGAR